MEARRGLWDHIRGLPWWRFAAGVAAGAAALFVTFLLRLLGLGAFLPEVALDFAVTRIPGSIESAFIGSLGAGAKLLGLATAVVAVLVAYGIGAVFYRWIERRTPNRWAVIALYAFVTAGLILLLVFPILDADLAGSNTAAGSGFAIFGQVIGGWVYAAVLDYLLVDVAARHPEGFSASRRAFLIGGAAAVGAFALALYGLGSLIARPARLFFASVADLFGKEVTPTEEFYVVTKNVIDPDGSSWPGLVVDGLVSTPLSLSYADLQLRMHSQEYATLECVSNEVGGNLISTARWSGIRLGDLLAEAGIQSAAGWVEFACLDGYTVAIPAAKALDPATLLVLLMNDAPLQGRHGAPARILVPGKYGMFSAKWLTRITAVQDEVRGFWQQKGWTNAGEDKTTAIITTPAPDAVVGSSAVLAGIAFAGDRGISKVEVSTDGGQTWTAAVLKAPLDSRLTWVLWTYDWSPPSTGAFRIVARAYDGAGVVQDPARAPPFPDGSSGNDSITLYANP